MDVECGPLAKGSFTNFYGVLVDFRHSANIPGGTWRHFRAIELEHPESVIAVEATMCSEYDPYREPNREVNLACMHALMSLLTAEPGDFNYPLIRMQVTGKKPDGTLVGRVFLCVRCDVNWKKPEIFRSRFEHEGKFTRGYYMDLTRFLYFSAIYEFYSTGALTKIREQLVGKKAWIKTAIKHPKRITNIAKRLHGLNKEGHISRVGYGRLSTYAKTHPSIRHALALAHTLKHMHHPSSPPQTAPAAAQIGVEQDPILSIDACKEDTPDALRFFARAVWLPDKLRKVWIIVKQESPKKGHHTMLAIHYKWKYKCLWLYILVPDVSYMMKMRNMEKHLQKLQKGKTPASQEYKDIIRRAQDKILTEKRIQRFVEKNKLSKEAELLENLDWRAFLMESLQDPGEPSAKFEVLWPYSLRNQMLLLHQMKARNITVSQVKSAGKWKQLGNSIAAGEKALYALTPDLPKSSDVQLDTHQGDDENPADLHRFVLLPRYFAYSQTKLGKEEATGWKGPALPSFDAEKCMKQLNVKTIPYLDKVLDATSVQSLRAGFSKEQRVFGTFEKLGVIAIRPGNPGSITTFFHELGHIVIGHIHEQFDYVQRRAEAELEAESVSMLCMRALGLGDAKESSEYIRAWWGKNPYPAGSAERIFSAAQKILKAGLPDQ